MNNYILCCEYCCNIYLTDNYNDTLNNFTCYICENILNCLHKKLDITIPYIYIYTDYILKIKYLKKYNDKCELCKDSDMMDIDDDTNNYITIIYPLLNIIKNKYIYYDGYNTRLDINNSIINYFKLPKEIYNSKSLCEHGIEYKIISAKIKKKDDIITLPE